MIQPISFRSWPLTLVNKPNTAPNSFYKLEKDTIHFSGLNAKQANKLFPSGVGHFNLAQGRLNDCQVLSSLYVLSRNPISRDILKNMIAPQDNGDLVVTFKKYPDTPITITPAESRQKKRIDYEGRTGPKRRPHVTSNDKGVRILELAYAKLMKARHPKRYQDVAEDKPLDVFLHPKFHYDERIVMDDFTGWKTNDMLFKPNGEITPADKQAILDVFTEYAQDPDGHIMCVYTNARSEEGLSRLDMGNKISAFHVMAVDNIDLNTETIFVKDPHDTEVGLYMNFDTFFEHYRGVNVAKVKRY